MDKKPNFFSKVKDFFSKEEELPKTIQAHYNSGKYTPIFSFSYDGEKNLGEIGPIIDYTLDHEALRLRSWQSFLESEISQTVLGKFTTWVIGSGLKLQAEPVNTVLNSEKITPPGEEFNELVEARFSVYAKSTCIDYSGMQNLHLKAEETFLNAIIGGDVLVILRYVNKQLKIQLVDGCHVQTPMTTSDYFNDARKIGNTIKHGIELSPSGEHVAFFVRKAGSFQYEKIQAKGKASGLTMAFLVYGSKYRLDNHRGMPLIARVLETLKKLERYKEATVGSAEERQKIAYAIVHKEFSSGEGLYGNMAAKAFDVGNAANQLPIDVNGTQLANNVAASTNKQTFNMPVGADMKILESKNELFFKDFYTVNIGLVCAALGIPPEVALSKYDSNFSASRAALKDWEHTINVNRSKFSFQFYQKIYNAWLEIEILKNKVQAPGFLIAKTQGNDYVINAYRNARFIGANVPHIDPLKEVEAERLKLGVTGASIPLTTVEKATEALNGGESDSNLKQYAKELDQSKKLKVVLDPVVVAPPKNQ
jgi:capsid protein